LLIISKILAHRCLAGNVSACLGNKIRKLPDNADRPQGKSALRLQASGPLDPVQVLCNATPHTWIAGIGTTSPPRCGTVYKPLTALLANQWTATVSLAPIIDLSIPHAIGADHGLVDGADGSVHFLALCIRFDVYINLLEDIWRRLLLELQIAPAADPTLGSNLRRHCGQASRVYTLVELEGPVKLE